MLGLGALAPEDAARRGLEVATSDAYRAEKPEEFEEIVRWRITDSPSLAAYSQQLMAGARFDGSRGSGGIYTPTLLIHGREDRFVPVANAAALADALPDATHLVFIEKAAQVNRYVSDFLKPRKPRKSPAKPDGREDRIARAIRSLTGKLLGGFTR